MKSKCTAEFKDIKKTFFVKQTDFHNNENDFTGKQSKPNAFSSS